MIVSGGEMPEFLNPLSQEEKVAVTGLSAAVYEALIVQKRSGHANVAVVSANNSSKFDLGALLMKLDIADLERLAESLKLTLQADRSAGSDMTEAERLYKKAFQ